MKKWGPRDKPHIVKWRGRWVSMPCHPRQPTPPHWSSWGNALWTKAQQYCAKLNAKLEKHE